MKAFVSIYVDLDTFDMTPERIYQFSGYLTKYKDEIYENLRNELAVGPSNFGRAAKAESGIKDGRETVEVKAPKSKKAKKVKPAPDNDSIGDEPVTGPIEADVGPDTLT